MNKGKNNFIEKYFYYIETLCIQTSKIKAISRKFTPIRGVNFKIAINKKLLDSIETFRH